MREEVPQIAEHAFGYYAKTQVVVDNPAHAVMLGLRRFGWMTFNQCAIRIFSWSAEYTKDHAACHGTLVKDTLLELEELGLVRLVYWPLKEGQTEQLIKEVRDANERITKRYEHTENDGEV